MDLDPAIFVIDFQDANKKQIKKKSFSAFSFWRCIYIIFQKDVTKQEKSGVFFS
jgi:hypothetical protein